MVFRTGFIELPLNDQMKLLQFTWAEMLTLQLAYRSIPFTGRLMFAKDFWLEEQSAKQCGASELFEHVSVTASGVDMIVSCEGMYQLILELVRPRLLLFLEISSNRFFLQNCFTFDVMRVTQNMFKILPPACLRTCCAARLECG